MSKFGHINCLFEQILDLFEQTTISQILNRRFDNHGNLRADYRCEIEQDENGNMQGCNERGFCNLFCIRQNRQHNFHLSRNQLIHVFEIVLGV